MGINIFMIDYLISGFGPVFGLKKRYPKISIWGHRIGYEAIKGNISMDALLTIAQLSGVFKPIFTITTPQVLDYLLPVFGDDAIYLSCGYYRDQDGSIDWDKVRSWCDSFK